MSHEALDKTTKGKITYPNVWFVGVTPRRNPELVVAVLWQNGEFSYYPARIGAQVVSAYVEKQRRLAHNLAPVKARRLRWRWALCGHPQTSGKASDGPAIAGRELPCEEWQDRCARPSRRCALELKPHTKSGQCEAASASPRPGAALESPAGADSELPSERERANEPPCAASLSFREFDWTLLGMVLLLCTLSVIEIYSATLHTKYVGLPDQADVLDRRRPGGHVHFFQD